MKEGFIMDKQAKSICEQIAESPEIQFNFAFEALNIYKDDCKRKNKIILTLIIIVAIQFALMLSATIIFFSMFEIVDDITIEVEQAIEQNNFKEVENVGNINVNSTQENE